MSNQRNERRHFVPSSFLKQTPKCLNAEAFRGYLCAAFSLGRPARAPRLCAPGWLGGSSPANAPTAGGNETASGNSSGGKEELEGLVKKGCLNRNINLFYCYRHMLELLPQTPLGTRATGRTGWLESSDVLPAPILVWKSH